MWWTDAPIKSWISSGTNLKRNCLNMHKSSDAEENSLHASLSNPLTRFSVAMPVNGLLVELLVVCKGVQKAVRLRMSR